MACYSRRSKCPASKLLTLLSYQSSVGKTLHATAVRWLSCKLLYSELRNKNFNRCSFGYRCTYQSYLFFPVFPIPLDKDSCFIRFRTTECQKCYNEEGQVYSHSETCSRSLVFYACGRARTRISYCPGICS